MTGTEVRKLTDEEIQVELKRLRGQTLKLRTQAVTEKVEDNSLFRKTRKDIARLLTEAHARSAKTRPAKASPAKASAAPAAAKKSAAKPAAKKAPSKKPAGATK